MKLAQLGFLRYDFESYHWSRGSLANERWDGIYGGKNKRYKHTTRKSPKIAQKPITQSRFAQFFLNRYGIFWMVPGESSYLENSEYVWQRGVGSLQGGVTDSWSRPSFQDLAPANCGVKNQRHSANFRLRGLQLTQPSLIVIIKIKINCFRK